MVVFPAPLGPINPWIRPASTLTVTRSTARRPPKLMESSWRESSVTGGALEGVGGKWPWAYSPFLLRAAAPRALDRPLTSLSNPADGREVAGRCYRAGREPVKGKAGLVIRASPTAGHAAGGEEGGVDTPIEVDY